MNARIYERTNNVVQKVSKLLLFREDVILSHKRSVYYLVHKPCYQSFVHGAARCMQHTHSLAFSHQCLDPSKPCRLGRARRIGCSRDLAGPRIETIELKPYSYGYITSNAYSSSHHACPIFFDACPISIIFQLFLCLLTLASEDEQLSRCSP